MFQGFEEVKEKLRKEGICMARTEKLIKDSGVAAAGAYDETVRMLLKTPQAKGMDLILDKTFSDVKSGLCCISSMWHFLTFCSRCCCIRMNTCE